MTTYLLRDTRPDAEFPITMEASDPERVRSYMGMMTPQRNAILALDITTDTGQQQTLTGSDLLRWASEDAGTETTGGA